MVNRKKKPTVDTENTTEKLKYKEMATHSSILVWRIPWTKEPDGLQSMGSQRDTTEWLHFTTEMESEMKTAREEEMNKGTKKKNQSKNN